MDGPAPARCDDSAAGKGAGGRLRYRLDIPSGGSATLWIAVAGSEAGPAAATSELDAALARPGRPRSQAKMASREQVASRTQVDLPGDRLLEQGIEWSKQNLADSVQAADDLKVRFTDEGKQYPPPTGTVPHVRFFGAGFPDYPWLFATDGEFTSFAAVAAGQFETVEDHLRALRDVSVLSTRPRARSCTRSSRTAASTTAPTRPPGTPTRPPSSRARSRWRGAGAATTACATSCIRSRCAACTGSSSRWTTTATAGRRGSATSSGPAWATRSST